MVLPYVYLWLLLNMFNLHLQTVLLGARYKEIIDLLDIIVFYSKNSVFSLLLHRYTWHGYAT